MNDILAIKNYILFLKRELKLSVSLHSCGSNLILKSELLVFNVHENPYCVYVKSNLDARNYCVKKQEAVAQKCKNGSFCGTCWAGVKEYVYPVMHEKRVVGFVCVSGFANEKGGECQERAAKKYGLDLAALQENYKLLKKQVPNKAYVDTLIYPLCESLELAHIRADEREQSDSDSFVKQVVYYIKKHYTENITSELLCKEFNCSRSHLSKVFNAEMQTTLPEYITKLRIELAKNLLKNSKLDICEVALSVGFNQPYYFTAIFKKCTGIAPSLYRKAENIEGNINN